MGRHCSGGYIVVQPCQPVYPVMPPPTNCQLPPAYSSSPAYTVYSGPAAASGVRNNVVTQGATENSTFHSSYEAFAVRFSNTAALPADMVPAFRTQMQAFNDAVAVGDERLANRLLNGVVNTDGEVEQVGLVQMLNTAEARLRALPITVTRTVDPSTGHATFNANYEYANRGFRVDSSGSTASANWVSTTVNVNNTSVEFGEMSRVVGSLARVELRGPTPRPVPHTTNDGGPVIQPLPPSTLDSGPRVNLGNSNLLPPSTLESGPIIDLTPRPNPMLPPSTLTPGP